MNKHRDFIFGVQVDGKPPLKGAWLRHVTRFKFWWPIHISGMAEALKLCTKGDYVKSCQTDDKSPLKGFAHVAHFYRATAMLSAVYPSSCFCLCVCVCVCVCVSHSGIVSKAAKRSITQITPHDSPLTLVFWLQSSLRNSKWITPYGGDKNKVGWVKFVTFDEKRAITRKRYKIDV